MKQTAAEWLINTMQNSAGMEQPEIDDVLERALEMEKEQMRDVWDESRSEYMGDNYIGKEKSFEDYYKETFNTNDK
jgi:hypothetical protein